MKTIVARRIERQVYDVNRDRMLLRFVNKSLRFCLARSIQTIADEKQNASLCRVAVAPIESANGSGGGIEDSSALVCCSSRIEFTTSEFGFVCKVDSQLWT